MGRHLSAKVADDFPLFHVDDRLGDLGRVVGDPFEVARGVDQPEPSVEPVGVAADLVLELPQDDAVMAIDAAVADDDGAGQRDVTPAQRVEAGAELVEDLQRQGLQLPRDRANGGRPPAS